MTDFKPLDEEKFNALTQKQRVFLVEYLRTNNKAEAAKIAGYSNRQAIVPVMTNDYIRSEIEHAKKQAAKQLGINAQYVLGGLKEIADRTFLNKKTTKSNDANAANKALELLGKHVGVFTEKLEVSVKSHEEVLDELE